MEDVKQHRQRIIAVVAATLVSLACGTNYAYSAWGPQFADRLGLSATQSNLVGSAGNIGMYASGIPFGHMVDTRGPRPGIALGGILIGLGYFFIKQAFDQGEGSMSVAVLCIVSFLTGCGSCSAFQGAIKTAALNWPNHRGTATAFPLSAFGLSAVFFVTFSGLLFPGSTSQLLLVLVIGTFLLSIGSLAFIRVPQATEYEALASADDGDDVQRRDSNQLQRTSKFAAHVHEASASSNTTLVSASTGGSDESQSLLSEQGDLAAASEASKHRRNSHSRRADITGHHLLYVPEFYLIFLLMGSLTGIGLMTINNIGNDAKSLWYTFDPDTPKSFILGRQLFHVSLISIFSFFGRLLSGIGSDLVVKRLKSSRYWCLVFSSLIFCLAQAAALMITDPHHLYLVSTLTGLAYGALFGVAPSIVADAFGVSGLAMNWGVMMLGPVIFGNLFNILYGRILDSHSHVIDGERKCSDGQDCYRSAYWFTTFASIGALCVGLWGVWHDRQARKKREAVDNDDEHLS